MCIFCTNGWKKAVFSETLAKISTLAQWTPCPTSSRDYSPDCRLIACKSYIPFLDSVIATVFRGKILIAQCSSKYPCFIYYALHRSLFVKMVREWHVKDNISTAFPASMVALNAILMLPINLFLGGHMPQPPQPAHHWWECKRGWDYLAIRLFWQWLITTLFQNLGPDYMGKIIASSRGRVFALKTNG